MFEEGKEFVIVNGSTRNTYKCASIDIEKSYDTKFGVYKPDISIQTECGKTIFVEVNYSNKKKETEYFAKWKDLNNTVVEIDVIQLFQSDYTENLLEVKAIFSDGKCFSQTDNKLGKDLYLNLLNPYKDKQSKDKGRQVQMQKLDWFYADICKYVHHTITDDDLLETFRFIGYQDMDIAYEMIKKKTCCKDIKGKFIDIANQAFLDEVEKLSEILLEKYSCKIVVVQLSPRIKRINIIRSALKSVKFYKVTYELKHNKIMNYLNLQSISDYLVRIESLLDKNLIANKLVNQYVANEIAVEYLDSLLTESSSFRCLEMFDYPAEIEKSIHINRTYQIQKKLNKYIRSKNYQSFIICNVFNNSAVVESLNRYCCRSNGSLYFSEKYILSDDVSFNKIDEYYLRILNWMDIFSKKYKVVKSKVINISNQNGFDYEEIILPNNPNEVSSISLKLIKMISTNESIIYYSNEIHGDVPCQFSELSNTKFIPVQLYLDIDDIQKYHMEEDFSFYYHSNHVLNYDYFKPFKEKTINVFYRPKSQMKKIEFYNLDKFDFVKATDEIYSIADDINSFTHGKAKYEDKNTIYSSDTYVKSEKITKRIALILKDFIDISSKTSNCIINVMLNISFTNINGNGYEPWLISDFISALNDIEICNFENIMDISKLK